MRVLCVLGKSPVPDKTGSRRRILRLIEAVDRHPNAEALIVVVSDDLDAVDREALDELPVPSRVVLPPRRRATVGDIARWVTARSLPFSWRSADVDALRRALVALTGEWAPDVVWCASAIVADAVGASRLPSVGDLARHVPLAVDAAHVERDAIDSQLAAAARALRRDPAQLRRIGMLALDRGPRVATERRAFAACSLVTACSDIEAAAARRTAGGRVVVVPNGVDLPDRLGWMPANRRLLFVGNLDYAPNLEALRRLAGELLPRLLEHDPSIILQVVGPGSERLGDISTLPGVEVSGYVPDLAVAYAGASLVLAPIRSGSGTKVKVLEAMAHGVPVVTTPTGVAGIDVVGGREVSIAEHDDDLVAAAVRLLDDEEGARRQRDAARKWIERDGSWFTIGEQFVDRLRELVVPSRGST